MTKQQQAYIYAFCAIVCWSTVATAFKLSLAYVRPLPLIFFASCFSCLTLFCIVLLNGKLKQFLHLERREYGLCFFVGVLNPTLYYLVLFYAYDRLPAQQAMAINYSWPIMLVLLSVFFLKQRLKPLDFLCILAAYAGVMIIALAGKGPSQAMDVPGVVLALVSTFIWALYWLLNVRIQRDAVLILFVSFLFSLPALAVLTFWREGLFWPSWYGVLGAAYIGVFEMGLTFALWVTALKLSDTTAKIGGLIFITPFLSLCVISVVLGENIHMSTFAGLAIIIVALIAQKLSHSRLAEG